MPTHREIETKFFVRDLEAIRARLIGSGAQEIDPRCKEYNVRYDTDDLALRRSGKMLRLRQGSDARLTFKGDVIETVGVVNREELEVVISDFDTAKIILESLGYKANFVYEKFRAIYELDGTHIMLDETPIGSFVEIEGADAESIERMAEILRLNWSASLAKSYSALFYEVKEKLGLTFNDMTFENFAVGQNRNLPCFPAAD